MHTSEQRAMVQRLARDYGLAHSSSLGELRPGGFSGGEYREQLARLTSRVGAMRPDSTYLVVFHVGTDTPELQAMQDLNTGGEARTSRQRQWELGMLLSPEFRDALARNLVEPVSYRTLAAERRRSTAPTRSGANRLLVYVYDGKGLQATANVPYLAAEAPGR